MYNTVMLIELRVDLDRPTLNVIFVISGYKMYIYICIRDLNLTTAFKNVSQEK